MKNPLLWTLALLSVLVIAVERVPAQSARLSADIPFQFVIGGETLPAGKYNVEPIGHNVMLVRSVDSRAAAIFLTIGVKGRTMPAEGKLVFSRYGDIHFLSQIWSPGVDSGRQLLRSRYERELASSKATVSTGEVLVGSLK